MSLRKLAVGAAVLLIAAVVALGGVGWYYSGEIAEGALVVDHSPDVLDLTVVEISDDTVTLATTQDSDLAHGAWRYDGLWGLEWDDGHATVGEILDLTDDRVVRRFTPGSAALNVGAKVRLSSFYFDGPPSEAFSRLASGALHAEEIAIDSDGASFPAWLVDGDNDTWAIFTHGKGATREEALRALATFANEGFPSLAITYRNDEGLATSDSGHYDYGRTEWRDLEAAVRYALDNGATDVILVGYSMGGGIVAAFMEHSDLADSIAALVLDAPMLDFGDVIDYGSERRSLPGILTWAGKTVASMRHGVDWEALDYLSRTDAWNVPVLLFHGDADRTIHFRLSDRLAEQRPDIVTYVRVPGATHVRAWNMDPDAYHQALRAFIHEVDR